MNFLRGEPNPLGASPSSFGVNFAFFATEPSLTLSLFHVDQDTPFLNIPLTHKTNNIWHIFIVGLTPPFAYTLSTPSNSSLLDPYAKATSAPTLWAQEAPYQPKARCLPPAVFNWDGVKKPKTPWKEWIIYEMHLRGFTRDDSSKVKADLKGTFLGMIKKIPHLLSLGVNAVEFLPIFEFDEQELKHLRSSDEGALCNSWGYSTVNFFSPMQRYASSSEWGSSIFEWKTLVKALHKNNIAVILDVVYNHTSEGGKEGPTLSFKGLAKECYYLLDEKGEYYNFSGTGNTLNTNQPMVRKLIVDSLSYWAEEMQVDAFRFDLASVFTRGEKGVVLCSPPLLEDLAQEPALQNVPLIAEAWDAGGLYQLGSFPGEKGWAEWNGFYRDAVRRFLKGDTDSVGNFAEALCGSQGLYKNYDPTRSVNFVTCHDGYTLNDLVSYEKKHNLDNGEFNNDGTNDNQSWNCGTEGDTENQAILSLRTKQKKNFIVALLLSIGVPMILMGDEYSHTKQGNNNTYCQDNRKNYFLWNILKKNTDFFSFFKHMIAFRKERSHLFCRSSFLSENDITWLGKDSSTPDWGASCHFLSYVLKDHDLGKDCWVVFNAGEDEVLFSPPPTASGKTWKRIVDTSLEPSQDFIIKPKKRPVIKNIYLLPPHSALIAELS